MLEKLPYDPLSVVCTFLTPDEVGEFRTVSKLIDFSVKKYSNKFWYKILHHHFPEDCDEYLDDDNYRYRCMQKARLIIPEHVKDCGYMSSFTYERKFFCVNKEQCLKVIAVYAIISFGASQKNKYHIVEYNPHKNIGECVDKNKMLISAFYNLPCDSSFFHLSHEKVDPYGLVGKLAQIHNIKSFDESVDKEFMQSRYNKKIGISVVDELSKDDGKKCVCEELNLINWRRYEHENKSDLCRCASDILYRNALNPMLNLGTFYNKAEDTRTTIYSEGECDDTCPPKCYKTEWLNFDMNTHVETIVNRFNNLIFDFSNHDLAYRIEETEDEKVEYVFTIKNIRQGFYRHAGGYTQYVGHRNSETVAKNYYGGVQYLEEVRLSIIKEDSTHVTIKTEFVAHGLL